MSKKVLKVQFNNAATQIGQSAIPESQVEPGRRNYDGCKTVMTYEPALGLTIKFEGTPYSQFVPNANIATLLIETVKDDDADKKTR